MYQVIDTIRCDGKLLLILDPQQVCVAPFQAGDTVLLHRPDGSTLQRVVDRIELNPASVVGVVFSDLYADEVPRLSRLELLKPATSAQSTDH